MTVLLIKRVLFSVFKRILEKEAAKADSSDEDDYVPYIPIKQRKKEKVFLFTLASSLYYKCVRVKYVSGFIIKSANKRFLIWLIVIDNQGHIYNVSIYVPETT